MKLTIGFALVALFPIAGRAELAGDWAGLLNLAQKQLHFVLHITGSDNAPKATLDSPDQNGFGMPASSIAFSGSTLKFTVQVLDVSYSGDVNSNGSIVGTFTQHGTSEPLILTRTVAAPRPAPTLTGAPGNLQNGLYHHNNSGVEFNLPAGWSVGLPAPAQGNPNYMTVLIDPGHRALFLSADMHKGQTYPENIPGALSHALDMLVARRASQTGAGAPHLADGYKIRPGSEEHTTIDGQQALPAVGNYELRGKKVTELLTWIVSEHTGVFYFAQVPSNNVAALQPVFEQIIQSAKIP